MKKQHIQEALYQSIKAVMEETSYHFDVTRSAHISKLSGDGRYEVTLDGSIYTLSPIHSETYQLNELVWVTVPSGDTDRMFILGKCK